MRSGRQLLVLMLTFGLAGCEGPRPSPTAPTPTAPSPPSGVPQVRVSGSVTDSAFRPVADATVEVLDGPHTGATARSGPTGAFSVLGTFDDSVRFRATKAGYLESTRTTRIPCAGCSRSVSFALAPDGPSIDLAGDYTFTFAAGCTAIPESARTRTYAATITRSEAVNQFDVAVRGASLLTDLAWEGVLLGVAGDYISMSVGNLHGDPGLIERVAADTYIGFDGEAQGIVGPPGAPTLSASFAGLIAYCELPVGSAIPLVNGRFTCPAGAAVTRAWCDSSSSGNGHRLTLTRR